MTENDPPLNWGRWGDSDEIGALNLIDDAARSRAAAEVRDGTSVSLARPTTPVPLTTGLAPVGTPATVPAPVMQVVNFNGVRPVAVTDSLLINTHNAGLTHFDALAHIPVGDQVYPGVPLQEALTPTGVRHASADHAGQGIVTRGVLLDLAPGGGRLDADHRVGGTQLDAALDRAGTSVHPGDAVVVRGGWDVDRPMTQPVPGLDLSAVAWLDEHGAALYIGDISDARPPSFPMPMHQVALARLGLPLVDAAALDDLADRCAALRRWSFMLVLAPPRITGTTGLAVNPLAVF
ncbi:MULTISPECIES: cyclase family protein [Streptomyces]|uniref:Cyclase n=1 Tax=Streptomyces albidoflavus TaxID=1886 RepID=A0AA37FGY6_9ACTN|nr:cyclase family protein [Streptomyces albidoflavus]RZE49209.1 cyclase [Streptomyces albidoflavus]RZE69628.1 cyclase [Streptomyces albidoflavus]WQG75183.1 cyclase family protein [Streptomyces albidoflavus]GHI49953.1 cyclase [Streptomyces albidoflavus]